MVDFRIKDISSLLSAFFDEKRIKKGDLYADFFSSWKAIAGERLAAHSRVIDIEKRILIVEAEHPGWVQLLQLRQAELLRAVSVRFPELELRGIIFRLGTEGRGAVGGYVERPGTVVPGSSLRKGAEGVAEDTQGPALSAIADSELRALLTGLKDSIDIGK